MRAYLGGQWVAGLPDEHRRPADYRIQVRALHQLERISSLYAVPARDPRHLLNYVREIGLRDSVRKVASRRSERHRNAKYVACGYGRIVEAPVGGSIASGQDVVFLLPAGPPCPERVVLPEALVRATEIPALSALPANTLLLLDSPDLEASWWEALRAWHPESGRMLETFPTRLALKECERLLAEADWTRARRLEGEATPIRCALDGPSVTPRPRNAPRAVLFGYGNYAKTVILPSIAPHVELTAIHELDPTQIPRGGGNGLRWSTSPVLEDGECPDAVLIAGYHHTHAPLACEALRRGAAVLVEKPLATTRAQLAELVATIEATGGRLFAGYQRRHHRFNELARRDLRAEPGAAISYHCVAFAVPLVADHWYRWPNSGSALVSNGCHWLDHFLHLNPGAEIEDFEARVAGDGSIHCWVSLANGAAFSMALTQCGSRRLGMREHVELRANGVTVSIEDASRYAAEDGRRVLRRTRISRQDAYRRMYASIGERIASGEPGDTVASIVRSTGLVLDLEEGLRRRSESLQISRRAPHPAVARVVMPEAQQGLG